MLSVIFALASYFCWAVGDVFGTISTRKTNSYSTTVWYEVFSIIFMLPLCFVFLDQLNSFTPSILLLIFILGVIAMGALVTFYEALKRGSSTVVGTLVSCFAALSVVISIVFLNEEVSFFQAAAITTIFVGIIISSLNFKELKNGKILKDKSIAIALASMSLFGIYFAFIRIPVDTIGWFWPAFFTALVSPVLIVPIKLFKVKIEKPTKNKALAPLMLNSALLTTAALTYNLGLEKGLITIVAPIAGSYPTLFAILSYFIFKDPLEKREIYGIIVALTGIVLLALSHI